MIIRLTNEAVDELRSIYLRYPDQSSRQTELIECLLYALGSGNNVSLGVSQGYLTIQQQQKWGK